MRKLFCLCAAVFVFCLAWESWAGPVPRKTLPGHGGGNTGTMLGRLPGTDRLNLALGLQLRNPDQLAVLLEQICDPASPNYRRYLTPEEFAERFGPAEAEYQKVIGFARKQGLTVVGTHANRMLLDVSGSVEDINQAFQVTLRLYHHPMEAHTFHAPDTEPSVEFNLAIVDISGLNNSAPPHPQFVITALNTNNNLEAQPNGGSGPGGAFRGGDFRAAYAPGVALAGSGQVVGLVAFNGYYENDIRSYEGQAGLATTPLENILIGGFNGIPTGGGFGSAEVSLDIEMAISMAPGLAKVVIYEAGPAGNPNDVLNRIATDNVAKQIGCSWAWGGGSRTTTDQIFQQMAAQGQSFFQASGDRDALLPGAVDNPSAAVTPTSSPYITQVGGTSLATGANGVWAAETVWNAGGGTGSGGGISSYYVIPSWQQSMDMTACHGSTLNRNFPDVALTADNVYVIYNNGQSAGFGGTSCAAPLWAGFAALINQQAAANGAPAIGFINPALYGLAKTSSYLACLHDITTGNNTSSSSPNDYFAVSGYDLCTGWGTPRGQNLINALATPEPLKISPLAGFIARGPVGGPFSPASQNFILNNAGGAALNWSLASTAAWLALSSGSGTIGSSAQAAVTVSLSALADTLSAGIYTTTLAFTDIGSGLIQTVPVSLLVGQPLVMNGNFERGDFSFWILNANGYNLVDTGSAFGFSPHAGGYAAILGQYGSLGYLSQTIPTIPGQAYSVSFWLNSPDGQTPSQFLVSWGGSTIFNATNLGNLGWTNLQFLVNATASTTVIQFGFRNDPTALGLDDVSVVPGQTATAPVFSSVLKTNNTIQFTWSSLAGRTYQVQYTTNLAGANWSNLGNALTAAAGTATAADSISAEPQRFYRVVLLP